MGELRMNLRVRDHLVYWTHRGLAKTGQIKGSSLDEIRQNNFQRVLIVATTAIGDAVLCTPLIDSLKAARPDVKIGFWVSAAAIPLFEGRRALNSIIPYFGKYKKVGRTLSELKKGQYDLALVANANDPDVIPMIWWSGCKRIIRRPQRNTIYSFMIANPDMLNAKHTSGHAIDRNLQFCDLLELPRGDVRTSLDIRPNTYNTILRLIHNLHQPICIIHPGASRSRKQWGAPKYFELAAKILHSTKGTVVLTGSEEEKSICDLIEYHLQNPSRVKNFAGKLRLDELAGLFKCSKLLVSGDTGPYHIAMAVGTPTVTLFAPWDIGSSSEINGPYFYRDRHIVIETAMNQPISTITTEAVFEKCESFLLT
jgi:ADP-heptose:LPS heptosyltransferase